MYFNKNVTTIYKSSPGNNPRLTCTIPSLRQLSSKVSVSVLQRGFSFMQTCQKVLQQMRLNKGQPRDFYHILNINKFISTNQQPLSLPQWPLFSTLFQSKPPEEILHNNSARRFEDQWNYGFF